MTGKIKLIFLLSAAALFLGAEENIYRYRLCLNGVWDAAFSKTEELPENTKWMRFRIPSGWGGMGRLAMDLPDGVQNAVYGTFRLNVFVPQEWRGQKMELEFEQLSNRHSVWFNGIKIHEYPEMMVWSRVPVPERAVRFGTWNELLVRTQGPGNQWKVGIRRDVFLHVLPPVSIIKAHARTSVQKKRIEVHSRLENTTGKAVDAELFTEVRDGEKTVLRLPSKKIRLDGQGELLSGAEWKDPVLWGFGEFGKPYLYTLRSELRVDGRTVDVSYERFGFREFRTQKDKFLLNEKPIFLKGDVGTHTRSPYHYAPAALQYYGMMRKAGFNLLRLHNMFFDPAVWFDAADEFGFLVETETWRVGNCPADDPAVLRRWMNYVRANCNHPSIILWCVDNERFQTGVTSVESLRKINRPLLKSYESLYRSIYAADPTRIVDMHDNHGIYAFVRMNLFSKDCFRIFNIHPYGNLKQEINSDIRNLGFHGEVPILVGEVFTHPGKLDFIQNPLGAHAEQRRNALAYRTQIGQAASPRHVSGIITCAENGDGRLGYASDGILRLGPWDSFAQDRKNAAVRKFQVIPRYPSLSGPGVKAKRLDGWNYNGGGCWPANLNWFDPNEPPYYFNIVNTGIREAFRNVDGKEYLQLPSFRYPEILVAAGKKERGSNIWLTEKNRPGVCEGVIADPDGNAWFRLNGTGTCFVRNGSREKSFEITAFPALTGKPGYEYLTWIDFGGNNVEQQKAELKKKAEKILVSVERKGEILQNHEFEFWAGNGVPYRWRPGKNPPFRSGNSAGGKFSVQLKDNSILWQPITLQKGRIYRVSAKVMRISGKKGGSILVKDRQQKTCFQLDADAPEGKWQTLSGEYIATGNESRFCLQNHPDGICLYDALSIRLLSGKTDSKMLPGPFSLNKDGFILDWLILGPFPNPGNAFDGYRASKISYLGAAGPECSCQLRFGEEFSAKFDDRAYWLPGDYKLRVVQWHAQKVKENIPVNLPEAGIASSPAANVAAYLGCELVSPTEQDVEFRLGSDDGYVFYLNGKEIGSFHGNRAAEENQERLTGKLRKGANRILVKAIQESGNWNFLCQVLQSNGKPAGNLSIVHPKQKNFIRNPEFSGKISGRELPGWRFDAVMAAPERKSGKNALCLQGNTANAVQTLAVEPGATYKISGWVHVENPSKPGCIGLRTFDYKWLIRLASSNHVGKWEYLEGYCTIPENITHIYFCCFNFFVGAATKIRYAQPSVTLTRILHEKGDGSSRDRLHERYGLDSRGGK